MILTCPECATRYEIDSAKFPAAGRKVRCKKCSHVWFQPGEAGEAAPEPEPVAAPEPEPVAEEKPVAAALFVEPEPEPAEDEPPVRAYRGTVDADESVVPARVAAKKPAPKKSGGWPRTMALVLGWIALIGAILVIGWSIMSYREQIATTWPKSASLFERIGLGVNTRGLNFSDVSHSSQMEDGQPVLVISGKLVNVGSTLETVPPLRVTLSDDAKHPIYGWNFSAAAHDVAPGKTVAFRTRLSNPPSAARHVDIRFSDNAE
jgi:predicted Zn finger-like uncharacterized protein